MQLTPSRLPWSVGVPSSRVFEFGKALCSAVEFKHQIFRLRVPRLQVFDGDSLRGGVDDGKSHADIDGRAHLHRRDCKSTFCATSKRSFQKCIAKEPQQRYATAVELAAALPAFGEGVPDSRPARKAGGAGSPLGEEELS